MISEINNTWFGYWQMKVCRLRDKKVVSSDYGRWKYVIMREVDVIRIEVLQIGHPSFAWILFHFIMCPAHTFLYF